MTITITNDSKSVLTVTNDSKTSGQTTFAEHTETFADIGPGGGTFSVPGIDFAKDSKISITITNESKT